MSKQPNTKIIGFEDFIANRNLIGARLGAILGAILMPTGMLLDWLTTPDHWRYFALLRCVAAVGCLFVLAVTYAPRARSHVFVLGVTPVLICSLAIEAMIVHLGGYSSPYYAGLNQLILAVGVIFYWRLGQILAACSLIILIWLFAPPFAAAFDLSPGSFSNNLYALVVSAVIAVASNASRYTAVRREQIARTQLAKTSAELAKALEQAKQIDRLKSEFFANISHELRTPLTLIIPPVDTLLENLAESADGELLSVIRQNATRLLRMIDDLLDLARLEAGGLRLNVSRVDLNQLAQQVLTNARPAAKAKKVEAVFEACDEECNVWVDPHRIEIVLTNLIGNAIKFTPSGGKVVARVVAAEDGARVEVSDTGPGIPEHARERIFERFYQVQDPGQGTKGGAGIGLALARELAEVHGGTLELESVPGEGSTFTLRLLWGKAHFQPSVIERRHKQVTEHPRRRAEDQLRARGVIAGQEMLGLDLGKPSSPPILMDRGRRARVLVVEDEQDLRRFIGGVLSREFLVTTAPDGESALKELERERPDLVLTDIMMPGMSGLELCSAIKDNPVLRQIPVILLTARGESETALDGFAAGADDFVAKPFHTKILLARIRAHLHTRSLSLQLADQARLASAGALAAGLAHEVKNPINAILNAAKVLQAGGATKVPNEKLLSVVLDGTERINTIVSALDAHAAPGDTAIAATCDVREGVETTLALLHHRLKNVTVHREFRIDSVHAHARALNQVLLNLVDNAIRSGASNLWVELQEHDGLVSIGIADDGPGVPPDVVHRIFDPFFTTREQGQGTGLGLHLSRRIVQDCGGELRYEPRTGGGARFVMEIPAMERAA